mgnify:CR=1 FL=1
MQLQATIDNEPCYICRTDTELIHVGYEVPLCGLDCLRIFELSLEYEENDNE